MADSREIFADYCALRDNGKACGERPPGPPKMSPAQFVLLCIDARIAVPKGESRETDLLFKLVIETPPPTGPVEPHLIRSLYSRLSASCGGTMPYGLFQAALTEAASMAGLKHVGWGIGRAAPPS